MTTTSDASTKHSHYHKDVSGLDTVDVYRLCALFGVDDSSGATQHAIKKLLCSGKRGVKTVRQDLQEAADTINRRIQMIDEDSGLAESMYLEGFRSGGIIDAALASVRRDK
jgi:hypothetical protein